MSPTVLAWTSSPFRTVATHTSASAPFSRNAASGTTTGPSEKNVSKFLAMVGKRGLRCRMSSAVWPRMKQTLYRWPQRIGFSYAATGLADRQSQVGFGGDAVAFRRQANDVAGAYDGVVALEERRWRIRQRRRQVACVGRIVQ